MWISCNLLSAPVPLFTSRSHRPNRTLLSNVMPSKLLCFILYPCRLHPPILPAVCLTGVMAVVCLLVSVHFLQIRICQSSVNRICLLSPNPDLSIVSKSGSVCCLQIRICPLSANPDLYIICKSGSVHSLYARAAPSGSGRRRWIGGQDRWWDRSGEMGPVD